ncbi:DNA invertase [Donghicola eburneus]|uniref:DNA invertase n=2 Tax=Donghicola eburneus TaxID=393278 RepID=A0A1M4MUS9_9RHOB|nr:DNA invertase [Donghicola eburneus]
MKSSVKADAWAFICAKYCSFAHYPSDFMAVAHSLYIVSARDCLWNLSDRAQHKETKGFWTSTKREHLLAFVYKRSFSSDILNCKRPDFMPLIGYARVSTEDQTPLPQSEALQTAGCVEIFEEHASGGNRARPVLARVLERVQSGDTLVVVRIDRLARSLSHLLEVIERLEAKGAFFRSLQDPIDTASPQGKFTLQVLGAAAEFERALIRERTKAGLASARAKGRVGGNPGLRAKDPAALRKVRLARQDGYMERLNETAQDWVPHVRRLRPDMAWEDVLRIINGPLPPDRHWTQSRLLRAVKAYVRDGFLPDAVLGRAGRRETDDRLPAIVAAIKGADPNITLQAICDRLESMRERTPRGRAKWQPSSVKMLLERAEQLALLENDNAMSK